MINEYSHITGVSVDELLGSSRKRDVSEPRQLYWYLLWESGYSYHDIARIGRRGRSNIYQAIRKVKFLLHNGDLYLNEMYNKVKHLINDNSGRF